MRADLACESGHDEVVAYLLSLLTQLVEPHAQAKVVELRRGSALFLAQKGETPGHQKVVELISGFNSAADTGAAEEEAPGGYSANY